MDKQIHMLVGVGEVGSALKKILEKKTILYWFDINPKLEDSLPESKTKIDVLHITFPQDERFISNVKKLIKTYKPSLTVIHSTTIIRTTEKLGESVVHSPILGQHDDLEKHIKTFRKAVGPNSLKAKRLAEKYLSNLFKLEFYKNSQTTESAKLISLVKFAMSIEIARYAEKLCKKLNLDYSQVYEKFSKTYNDGYELNNFDQFKQPILTPPQGKIGGSCVCPGVLKAQKSCKSKILESMLEVNE